MPDLGPTGPAATGPERRPTALRRRLVLVLAAVVLLVTVGLAVASAIALRTQLVAQVDHELRQASDRLARGDGPAQPRTVPATRPRRNPAGPTTRRASPGTGPGSAVLRYDGGELVLAEYVTPGLQRVTLDDTQVAALEDVPTDGARARRRPPRPRVVPRRAPHHRGRAARRRRVEHGPGRRDRREVPARRGRARRRRGPRGRAPRHLARAALAAPARRRRRRRGPRLRARARAGRDRGHPRVPDDLTDERTEVGQVGAALNRMLENVETSLQARHDSGDPGAAVRRRREPRAAHPLASIRGYAELVRRSPTTCRPRPRARSTASRPRRSA